MRVWHFSPLTLGHSACHLHVDPCADRCRSRAAHPELSPFGFIRLKPNEYRRSALRGDPPLDPCTFIWMLAVKYLGAARTAIFMNLIPIFTAIVAAIFLSEALYIYHLVGGGMTVAEIILGQRKSDRGRSDQKTVATRAQWVAGRR